MLEMNVFIYAGATGSEIITEKILKENEKIEVGKTYSVPADKTLFIVLYPNILKEQTELELTYWIGEDWSGTPELGRAKLVHMKTGRNGQTPVYA